MDTKSKRRLCGKIMTRSIFTLSKGKLGAPNDVITFYVDGRRVNVFFKMYKQTEQVSIESARKTYRECIAIGYQDVTP